jgi:hypothetical protein
MAVDRVMEAYDKVLELVKLATDQDWAKTPGGVAFMSMELRAKIRPALDNDKGKGKSELSALRDMCDGIVPPPKFTLTIIVDSHFVIVRISRSS